MIQGNLDFSDYFTCCKEVCTTYHSQCHKNHEKCQGKDDLFHNCNNHETCKMTEKVQTFEHGKQHLNEGKETLHDWKSLYYLQKCLNNDENNETKNILLDDRIKLNFDIEKIKKQLSDTCKNICRQIQDVTDSLIGHLDQLNRNKEIYELLMKTKDEQPFQQYHDYLRKFIDPKPENLNQYKRESKLLKIIKGHIQRIEDVNKKYSQDLSVLTNYINFEKYLKQNQGQLYISNEIIQRYSLSDDFELNKKFLEMIIENNFDEDRYNELVIDCSYSKIKYLFFPNNLALFNKGLKSLKIITNKSYNRVSDISVLKTVGKITELVELDISLSQNNIQDISVLESWGNLKGLQKLKINLKQIYQLNYNKNEFSNISPLKALGSLSGLVELDIDLSQNIIQDISAMESWGNLKGLQKLKINLSYNQLSNISPLKALGSLSGLVELDIDLSENNIQDISALESWGNLKGLQKLKINLSYNQLSNISPLEALGSLSWLVELDISLWNYKIQDISALESWGNLKGLQKLNINLSYNPLNSTKVSQNLEILYPFANIYDQSYEDLFD